MTATDIKKWEDDTYKRVRISLQSPYILSTMPRISRARPRRTCLETFSHRSGFSTDDNLKAPIPVTPVLPTPMAERPMRGKGRQELGMVPVHLVAKLVSVLSPKIS